MATNVTQKDQTLQEVIEWCEQEADKQGDKYRTTYGDERLRADAAGDTLERVAAHCREMLGYGGNMPLEVPNQSEDAKGQDNER